MSIPVNAYTVTVSDAHSHTLTYTVAANSSQDAITATFARDLTVDMAAASFVTADTITVTSAIA